MAHKRLTTPTASRQTRSEAADSAIPDRALVRGPMASVLALQHGAGNQAVARLMRSIRAESSGKDTVPAAVQHGLHAPGEPLASAVRREMEGRFGADFRDVQV